MFFFLQLITAWFSLYKGIIAFKFMKPPFNFFDRLTDVIYCFHVNVQLYLSINNLLIETYY